MKARDIMYERIDRIKKRVVIDQFPICIEKFRIAMDMTDETKNDPVIIRRAKIMSATLERVPIAIAPDELIVGIGASKPMGLEIDPDYGIWSQDEILSLIEDGYQMDAKDVEDLQELNKRYDPPTLIGQMGNIVYENERIISLLKAGIILPPWKGKDEGKGVGGGYCQSGLGLGPSLILLCIDYTKMLHFGTDALIRQAKEERSKLRFHEKGAVEKFNYYSSVIMQTSWPSATRLWRPIWRRRKLTLSAKRSFCRLHQTAHGYR
jgi:formate C-acetyltransferase